MYFSVYEIQGAPLIGPHSKHTYVPNIPDKFKTYIEALFLKIKIAGKGRIAINYQIL